MELKARSLTIGEIKSLRSAGVDPIYAEATPDKPLDYLKLDADCNEKIIAIVLGDDIPDDTPYGDLYKFANDCYKLTYGKELEVKNS